MVFKATIRLSFLSLALKTTPMPPVAISSSSSKSPNSVPALISRSRWPLSNVGFEDRSPL